MDCYEGWFDLREGVKDLEFCSALQEYLGLLQSDGLIESFRLKRRKLGFSPDNFGEFNVTMEFRDLAQMDRAFSTVATRSGEIERLHSRVYSSVKNAKFALYRDFPDPVRAPD